MCGDMLGGYDAPVMPPTASATSVHAACIAFKSTARQQNIVAVDKNEPAKLVAYLANKVALGLARLDTLSNEMIIAATTVALAAAVKLFPSEDRFSVFESRLIGTECRRSRQPDGGQLSGHVADDGMNVDRSARCTRIVGQLRDAPERLRFGLPAARFPEL